MLIIWIFGDILLQVVRPQKGVGMNSKTVFRNKGFKALTAALIILLSLLLFVAGGGGEVKKSTLTWTMGLQNESTRAFYPFSAPVRVNTGETYFIVITPSSPCYAYVVYESSNGDDIVVIFAGQLKKDETWYSQGLQIAPPQGSETFYVVVSLEEQKALATRIAALNANSGSIQKRALMNEIYNIRSEVSQFRKPREKPILRGGAQRGDPERSQGVEFSGLSSYVKTISIEH